MQSMQFACAPRKGVFAERSLGSWLKFPTNSVRPVPCHMQSTAACLCSTQGSFCGAVLEQSAQILSRQCLASTLSHAGDRSSPVLHMREISWTLLRRTTPYICCVLARRPSLSPTELITWERWPLDRLLIDPGLFFSLDCPCEGQVTSRQWRLCR